MIIGLTGNIASGKSTVAQYLRELGAQLVDADQVARQVVEPYTPALEEILSTFGPGLLLADGSLNRQALGKIVFQNPEARKKLEQITHPRIEEEINRQVADFRATHPKGVLVLEVPLLIEVGWHRKVDVVWLVTVDEEDQLTRLMRRDKLSREEALRRMHSQMPQEQKKNYAQVIINNSAPPKVVQQQVQNHWERLIFSHHSPENGI